MDDVRALIRHQSGRAERLRRAARTHRELHADDAAARPGPRAAVAALLRRVAERLDPTPTASPRARSI